jgi:hypothetical protein
MLTIDMMTVWTVFVLDSLHTEAVVRLVNARYARDMRNWYFA